MQRLAGGADARQQTRRGKFGAEENRLHAKASNQKRQQQRERLVSDGVLDVHADRARDDESAATHKPAGVNRRRDQYHKPLVAR